MLRDAAAVDLVTSAIVEVLSCHEPTVAVAACACSVPLHDICDLLVVGRFGCAEDEHRATAWGFTGNVPRERDMTVLQILHGDVIACGNLEFGEGRSVV